MRKSHKILLASTVGISILAASAGVFAQQAAKPDTVIKLRQSTFQFIGWTCGRVKNALQAPTYDRSEVIQASNALAGAANSGLAALFAPGTDQGKGWHDTAIKSEFFANNAKSVEYATNLARETSELQKVANTGDQAAVKAQFAKVGATCKACHDDYRRVE